jgi:hypothetical protein
MTIARCIWRKCDQSIFLFCGVSYGKIWFLPQLTLLQLPFIPSICSSLTFGFKPPLRTTKSTFQACFLLYLELIKSYPSSLSCIASLVDTRWLSAIRLIWFFPPADNYTQSLDLFFVFACFFDTVSFCFPTQVLLFHKAYLAYHLLQLSTIIQCSHISCSNLLPYFWSESPHHCLPLVTVKFLLYDVATNSCVRKAFSSHKVVILSLARLILHFQSTPRGGWG